MFGQTECFYVVLSEYRVSGVLVVCGRQLN